VNCRIAADNVSYYGNPHSHQGGRSAPLGILAAITTQTFRRFAARARAAARRGTGPELAVRQFRGRDPDRPLATPAARLAARLRRSTHLRPEAPPRQLSGRMHRTRPVLLPAHRRWPGRGGCGDASSSAAVQGLGCTLGCTHEPNGFTDGYLRHPVPCRDLGYFPGHSIAAPGLSHVCPALGKLDNCLAGIPIAV
jgi:hypothetical protein